MVRKGFGLIAYLMNLKINEISIQPEQLFIRAEPDEFLRIENKNYYDFQKFPCTLKQIQDHPMNFLDI